MNVYLNSIEGIPDAMVSLLMSKRSWTREKEVDIRKLCHSVLDYDGSIRAITGRESYLLFEEKMQKLVKYGTHHISLLRFIDMSFTVEGIHRAGQDDWDAHAHRFNNRIVRASTRLATFGGDEMSDFYKDKIIPLDVLLSYLDIEIPEETTVDGKEYVRSTNGYILKEFKDDKDVKRGLYMECIPSNFIFKVNMTEWGHVYKLRNKDSHANPEVKLLCETIADLLYEANPFFTRKLFCDIEN